MRGCLVNNVLEGMWKEVIIANLKQDLKITQKNFKEPGRASVSVASVWFWIGDFLNM